MAFIGSLLNSNPLVDTATTDDERPTPGHVYRELISPSVCERLVKHILTKLAMPSAAVKLKSLLVCQQLLEKGNPHFQKELQHNVNPIRACLDFRGPPDPVRGDAIYKLVRDKTAALLNQLYEVKEPSTPFDQQSYNDKYEGMGSGSNNNIASQHMSSAQSYSNQPQSNTTTLGGGGHTMHLGSGTNLKFMTNTNYQGSNPENKIESRNTGFGSPAPVEDSKLAYVAGVAQNVLTQIGTTLNITKNEAPVVVDKGRYVAPNLGLRPTPTSSLQQTTTTYSPSTTSNQPTSLTQLAQERPIASGPMGGWEQVTRERASSSGMSNTVEYSVIDQFCNPGVSQQANPSRLQISQFLARIQKDDVRMEVIYYLLQEQLSNQDWKRKLRALYFIHELIVNNMPLAAHYFSDQGLASVLALTTSVQKTLQEKAVQIVQHISPQSLAQPTPEPVQETPLANTNTSNQGVASIFSSLSISDPSQQNEVSQHQQRKVSQSSSKYTPHHTPQPQQHYVKPPSQTNPQFQSQPAQTTLFGFPTTQTTTTNFQPTTQDNTTSLFSNLNLQTQPQSQPQPQQQSNNNIFDEILFPNQKSLLGSQSLIGDPEPAPKTNDPNNIFFSSAITSSPPHNNTNNNIFDLSFYAQPQLQTPITFPSSPNYSSSSSSGYNSNGRNASSAFSPSAPYSGPYASNPKKFTSSSPSVTNQKSADPFYFGDIKTLDLNL